VDSPARGAWRPARALALTAVTVVLAASAHAAAGGMLPSLWALSALTVPTACVAVLLTRRRLSTPLVLGVLGVGQFLLHEGFAVLATDAHCSTSGTGHHQSIDACSTAVHHDPTSGMLLAHVLATLVTGLLLARGEQVLWALADRLDPVLPVVARLNLPVAPRLPRHPEPLPTRPRIVDVAVPVRRGPPARVRAAT
jgi:hypothetical protein